MAGVRRNWLIMSCLGTSNVSHFVSWIQGSDDVMSLMGTESKWFRRLKVHPGAL